jgi:pimeloyl-ACP methyl ester carboxylesterase
MSAIIIGNDIVHYEVLGRGRPLIFIHGWVGSWRYWIPAMQATSISFRSYALDLFGFGDTSKNPERYSLEAQVELLDGFMEEMGIGKVALIGHGLGAIVAMMYAKQYPQFVDRVMAIAFPATSHAINTRLTTDPPVTLGEWLLGRTPGAQPAQQETPKTDAKAIATSISTLNGTSLTTLTNALESPTLFVQGQNDPAIAQPDDSLLEALPELSHVITLENTGHFPMLEQQNKFNRLVTDFLALGSGETPRSLQIKEEWKRRVR